MTVPTSLPERWGAYVVLRPLSDENDVRRVYAVALSGSDKPWALKVLGPADSTPPEAIKAQAKILARMSCPFLARTLDSPLVEGHATLLMAHVPGRALSALILKARSSGVPIATTVLATIARDVVEAVGYLAGFEGAGLVHGNLTPSAVLVGADGNTVLAGFRPGLLQPTDPASAAQDLTGLGSLLVHLFAGAETSSPHPAGATTMQNPVLPPDLADLVAKLLDPAATPEQKLQQAKKFGAVAATAEQRAAVVATVKNLFGPELAQEAEQDQRLVKDAAVVLATSRHAVAEYPPTGTLVGPYRISTMLGEGGMGRVYEATHAEAQRRVALKVLHPGRRTPHIQERFRREAAAASSIDHPNVVKIEAFDETSDKKYLYLAMEYLEGETLDQAIAKKTLVLKEAVRIAAEVCEGVSAAHAAGVIHRDLKPGNIMLVGERQEVKILDFGLARVETEDQMALTRVGDMIGTSMYVAPEQGQGATATTLFDVYAIGELLYEMLTGTLPHVATNNGDLLRKKLAEDPTPIGVHKSDLPKPVVDLVMKALARVPVNRPASAKSMAEDLRAILVSLDARVPVVAATAALATAPMGRKIPWAAGGLAVVGLIALVVFGLRVLGSQQGGAPAPKGLPSGVGTPAAVVPNPPPVVAVPGKPTAPATPKVHPSPPTAPVAEKTPAAQPQRTFPRAASATNNQRGKLRAAEELFEAGNTVDAIQLAQEALDAGAGANAQLALGKYYQSLRLPQEALKRYRAVLEADPHNQIAAAAIQSLQSQARPKP